jgi:hypothetical protein
VLFLALTTLHVCLSLLLFQTRTKVRGHVGVGDGLQDLRCELLTNVYKHVRIREPLRCDPVLRFDPKMIGAVDQLAAKVVLEHLSIDNVRDPVVVPFKPAAFDAGFDEDEVMATVYVTRVHQNAVQLVDPVVCPDLGRQDGIKVVFEVD